MKDNGSTETGGQLKVILLEAGPVLRHLFEEMIREWQPDARLLAFDNGYDAWKELVCVRPGLLITGDNHEGLAGNLIVTWVAARYTTCAVLWTSATGIHDPATLFGGLPHEILPKPFQRQEFMDKLNRLVPSAKISAQPAAPDVTRPQFAEHA